MTAPNQPVIILGAGINGAALARELVLNDVPVVVIDKADIASGTTAYSSRLIHGGLRYLEYGEFSLVRESLDERGDCCSWLRNSFDRWKYTYRLDAVEADGWRRRCGSCAGAVPPGQPNADCG